MSSRAKFTDKLRLYLCEPRESPSHSGSPGEMSILAKVTYTGRVVSKTLGIPGCCHRLPGDYHFRERDVWAPPLNLLPHLAIDFP